MQYFRTNHAKMANKGRNAKKGRKYMENKVFTLGTNILEVISNSSLELGREFCRELEALNLGRSKRKFSIFSLSFLCRSRDSTVAFPRSRHFVWNNPLRDTWGKSHTFVFNFS